MGEDVASTMARTVNDNGEIPYDLVNKLQINEDEKAKIYLLLLPLTTKNSLKNLSERLNFKDILKQYNPSPESNLYRNLQEACMAANKSRELIKASSTHPQENLSYLQFCKLNQNFVILTKIHQATRLALCILLTINFTISLLAIKQQMPLKKKVNLKRRR